MNGQYYNSYFPQEEDVLGSHRLTPPKPKVYSDLGPASKVGRSQFSRQIRESFSQSAASDGRRVRLTKATGTAENITLSALASVVDPTAFGTSNATASTGQLTATAASATALPGNRPPATQCRDASTVDWELETAVGRPISRAEALRIARQVLEQAERERIALVNWEATRGISWEDGG